MSQVGCEHCENGKTYSSEQVEIECVRCRGKGKTMPSEIDGLPTVGLEFECRLCNGTGKRTVPKRVQTNCPFCNGGNG